MGLFYNGFRVIITKRNAEELEHAALTLRQYINFSALLIIRHYLNLYINMSFPLFPPIKRTFVLFLLYHTIFNISIEKFL